MSPMLFVIGRWNLLCIYFSSVACRGKYGLIGCLVWSLRNDVVFNGGNVNSDRLIDITLLRVARRGKARWPTLKEGVDDFIRFPQLIKVSDGSCTSRGNICWLKPNMGRLKFNVAGSALGQPGPAGIRGVLRDHEVNVKLVFSKSIGIADSNLVEILTVGEALILYASLRRAQSHKLLIESDSVNIVKWVNNPNLAPWRLRRFVSHIECLKTQAREWSIVHTFKEANDKSGVHCIADMVRFYEN
ncbi:hypothetical protein DITRI_Ditri12bG0043400 [Diplodiscus trichospermus]